MDTHQPAPILTEDEAKIRAAALDYVVGVHENDRVRMERSLHPELAKCVYLPGPDGKSQFLQMSALALVQRISAPGRPSDPTRRAEVVILDRFEGAASVRAEFDTWVDYLHVVKFAGEWKIVHVLWELKPDLWTELGGTPGERVR